MNITEALRRTISYIDFFYHSRTIQRIHSPFVFNLLNDVFNDKKNNDDITKIHSLIKELKKDNTSFVHTDFGASNEKEQLSIKKKKIKTIAKKVISSKKEGRILFNITKHFQPETILELGTSFGIGTSYMAMGNPSANIITMEGCPETIKIANKNLKKLNINNVKIVEGDFRNTLNTTLNTINKLDFVYFDGNHREEPTIEYFEKCLKKAHNDTIFFFDDINWSKGMKIAWERIINHDKTIVSINFYFFGMIFFRKEMTKQKFIIRI